jgi:hypothetical protein
MPNWKKVIVSGSDATLQDVTIDDWGSVSSSLSEISTTASQVPTLQQVTDSSPFSGEAITTDEIYAASFKTNDFTGTMQAGRYYNRITGSFADTGMDLYSQIGTHPSASIAFRLGGFALPLFMERSGTDKREFNTIFNRFYGNNTIEIWASGSGKTLEIVPTGIGGENTTTTIHSGQTILRDSINYPSAGDTSKLYVQGNISSSDAFIDNWGSVSSSLAGLSSSIQSSANPTLQDVTDNGATTTNNLNVAEITGSGDFLIEKTLPLLVLNNQGSVPLIEGYGSYINLQTDQWNSGPTGSSMGAINATDQSASHKGSISFDKATTDLSDIKFYNTNFGNSIKPALNISSSGDLFSSGSISGSDAYIDDWGSVSSSLASINSGTTSLTLQQVTDNGSITTNVITASAYSGSYIDLTPLATGDLPAYKDGRLFYDADNGAVSFYNEEADISLQIGQEFYIKVQNNSASPIPDGTPVQIVGAAGDNVLVAPAVAEDHSVNTPYENHIIGLATHEIAGSGQGYVTTQGVVRGIDTSDFSAGDILYLQTGSAGFRNTPPPFPYDTVQVGFVQRVQSQNGEIYVKPSEPVHFNNISGLSGSATGPGDLWVYQANNSWTPTKTLSGSYTIDNGNLTVGGDVDADDVTIDDWGSVSASLAAVNSGVGALTLQAVTDTGATTTNAITASGLEVTGDLTVVGTASIAYLQSVTGSAKIIGDSYIILNADSPTERYAGIKVIDSGSSDTGSLEYDSVNNHWFYESTTEGYASGLISGPRDTRGAITWPSNNKVVKGIGGNHIDDSNITDTGTLITLDSDTDVSGSLDVSGGITGSDVTIGGWGSISSSLASIESTGSSQNLQQVTDNGNTTTNQIIAPSFVSNTEYIIDTIGGTNGFKFRSGSTGLGGQGTFYHDRLRFTIGDNNVHSSYVEFNSSSPTTGSFALEHQQATGEGGKFVLRHTPSSPNNWIPTDDYFAVDWDDVSGRIKHPLSVGLLTNSSSLDLSADDGTLYLSGITSISSSHYDGFDVFIKDWGSVSSSLASLEAGSTPTLQDVTDNGDLTTNSMILSSSSSQIIISASGDTTFTTGDSDTSGIITTRNISNSGQSNRDGQDSFKRAVDGYTYNTYHTEGGFAAGLPTSNGTKNHVLSVRHDVYVGATLEYTIYNMAQSSTEIQGARTGTAHYVFKSGSNGIDFSLTDTSTTDLGEDLGGGLNSFTDHWVFTGSITPGTAYFDIEILRNPGGSLNNGNIVGTFKLNRRSRYTPGDDVALEIGGAQVEMYTQG